MSLTRYFELVPQNILSDIENLILWLYLNFDRGLFGKYGEEDVNFRLRINKGVYHTSLLNPQCYEFRDRISQ